MFNLLYAVVDTDLAAQAEAIVEPVAPWTDAIGTFALPVLMVAFVWFIMIRPENKRRKEMKTFREGLKKGDKVITAGGIHATIKEVKDTTLLIEVDSNVTLRINKDMVVADTAQQAAK